MPDRYIDQAGQDDMYAQAGLDPNRIVASDLTAIGDEALALQAFTAGREGN